MAPCVDDSFGDRGDWGSVNMPPADLPKGGIEVPATPAPVTRWMLPAPASGQIDRIRERDRRSILAVFAVACGAVLFVEGREVKHIVRPGSFGVERAFRAPCSQRTRSKSRRPETQGL